MKKMSLLLLNPTEKDCLKKLHIKLINDLLVINNYES